MGYDGPRHNVAIRRTFPRGRFHGISARQITMEINMAERVFASPRDIVEPPPIEFESRGPLPCCDLTTRAIFNRGFSVPRGRFEETCRLVPRGAIAFSLIDTCPSVPRGFVLHE